jgi:hypothetical protein
LGIVSSSFELSFDKAPARVDFTIEVYEKGKMVWREPKPMWSVPNAKKHTCTVLFRPLQDDQAKLHITIVTLAGSWQRVIDNPFADPGQIYPGPRLDGRVVLGLRADRGGKAEGPPPSVNDVTLENAAKALVLRVVTE